MTNQELETTLDRLYAIFPAIGARASQAEYDEWAETMGELDYEVAWATISSGKRTWTRMPSHAAFRELYDATTPRQRPATRGPLTCDGKRYILADPYLADDFAAEQARAMGSAAGEASSDTSRPWRDTIRRQLAGEKGPLAGSLQRALADEDLVEA